MKGLYGVYMRVIIRGIYEDDRRSIKVRIIQGVIRSRIWGLGSRVSGLGRRM